MVITLGEAKNVAATILQKNHGPWMSSVKILQQQQ